MKFFTKFLMLLVVVSFTTSVYAGNGTLVGKIVFEGDNPNYPETNINKDPEVCGTGTRPSEKLVLSAENGIKNVFISVLAVNGEKLAVPAENPVFGQAKCNFSEHVMVIPTGSTVDFPNMEDQVMHNLHSYSMKNRPFNKGVPFGQKISMKFTKPETVKITCDVHKWMIAYLIVHDDPYYAITDADGNFKIENVPTGTYKLQIWQESLGRKKIDIDIKDGEETKVDFAMKPRKRRKKS